MNIGLRVLRFKKEELGGHHVCDRIHDRPAQKYDPLLQKARIDVIRSLSKRGFLDDRGDEDLVFGVHYGSWLLVFGYSFPFSVLVYRARTGNRLPKTNNRKLRTDIFQELKHFFIPGNTAIVREEFFAVNPVRGP